MRKGLQLALAVPAALALMSLTTTGGQSAPSYPTAAADSDSVVFDDTLRPVIIRPVEKPGGNIKVDMGPRVPNVSDVIGAKATDKIMHPFAVGRRKKERHRRKMERLLREYEQIQTPNEALIEAMRQEGINVDSLLEIRKQRAMVVVADTLTVDSLNVK